MAEDTARKDKFLGIAGGKKLNDGSLLNDVVFLREGNESQPFIASTYIAGENTPLLTDWFGDGQSCSFSFQGEDYVITGGGHLKDGTDNMGYAIIKFDRTANQWVFVDHFILHVEYNVSFDFWPGEGKMADMKAIELPNENRIYGVVSADATTGYYILGTFGKVPASGDGAFRLYFCWDPNNGFAILGYEGFCSQGVDLVLMGSGTDEVALLTAAYGVFVDSNPTHAIYGGYLANSNYYAKATSSQWGLGSLNPACASIKVDDTHVVSIIAGGMNPDGTWTSDVSGIVYVYQAGGEFPNGTTLTPLNLGGRDGWPTDGGQYKPEIYLRLDANKNVLITIFFNEIGIMANCRCDAPYTAITGYTEDYGNPYISTMDTLPESTMFPLLEESEETGTVTYSDGPVPSGFDAPTIDTYLLVIAPGVPTTTVMFGPVATGEYVLVVATSSETGYYKIPARSALTNTSADPTHPDFEWVHAGSRSWVYHDVISTGNFTDLVACWSENSNRDWCVCGVGRTGAGTLYFVDIIFDSNGDYKSHSFFQSTTTFNYNSGTLYMSSYGVNLQLHPDDTSKWVFSIMCVYQSPRGSSDMHNNFDIYHMEITSEGYMSNTSEGISSSTNRSDHNPIFPFVSILNYVIYPLEGPVSVDDYFSFVIIARLLANDTSSSNGCDMVYVNYKMEQDRGIVFVLLGAGWETDENVSKSWLAADYLFYTDFSQAGTNAVGYVWAQLLKDDNVTRTIYTYIVNYYPDNQNLYIIHNRTNYSIAGLETTYKWTRFPQTRSPNTSLVVLCGKSTNKPAYLAIRVCFFNGTGLQIINNDYERSGYNLLMASVNSNVQEHSGEDYSLFVCSSDGSCSVGYFYGHETDTLSPLVIIDKETIETQNPVSPAGLFSDPNPWGSAAINRAVLLPDGSQAIYCFLWTFPRGGEGETYYIDKFVVSADGSSITRLGYGTDPSYPWGSSFAIYTLDSIPKLLILGSPGNICDNYICPINSDGSLDLDNSEDIDSTKGISMAYERYETDEYIYLLAPLAHNDSGSIHVIRYNKSTGAAAGKMVDGILENHYPDENDHVPGNMCFAGSYGIKFGIINYDVLEGYQSYRNPQLEVFTYPPGSNPYDDMPSSPNVIIEIPIKQTAMSIAQMPTVSKVKLVDGSYVALFTYMSHVVVIRCSVSGDVTVDPIDESLDLSKTTTSASSIAVTKNVILFYGGGWGGGDDIMEGVSLLEAYYISDEGFVSKAGSSDTLAAAFNIGATLYDIGTDHYVMFSGGSLTSGGWDGGSKVVKVLKVIINGTKVDFEAVLFLGNSESSPASDGIVEYLFDKTTATSDSFSISEKKTLAFANPRTGPILGSGTDNSGNPIFLAGFGHVPNDKTEVETFEQVTVNKDTLALSTAAIDNTSDAPFPNGIEGTYGVIRLEADGDYHFYCLYHPDSTTKSTSLYWAEKEPSGDWKTFGSKAIFTDRQYRVDYQRLFFSNDTDVVKTFGMVAEGFMFSKDGADDGLYSYGDVWKDYSDLHFTEEANNQQVNINMLHLETEDTDHDEDYEYFSIDGDTTNYPGKFFFDLGFSQHKPKLQIVLPYDVEYDGTTTRTDSIIYNESELLYCKLGKPKDNSELFIEALRLAPSEVPITSETVLDAKMRQTIDTGLEGVPVGLKLIEKNDDIYCIITYRSNADLKAVIYQYDESADAFERAKDTDDTLATYAEGTTAYSLGMAPWSTTYSDVVIVEGDSQSGADKLRLLNIAAPNISFNIVYALGKDAPDELASLLPAKETVRWSDKNFVPTAPAWSDDYMFMGYTTDKAGELPLDEGPLRKSYVLYAQYQSLTKRSKRRR
jgi:hypothetical protein